MKQKSDEELYEVILTGNCDEKYAAAVCLMTPAGDIEKTFTKAAELCESSDPAVRREAARILGQLGTPDRPFRQEACPLLTKLLENDADSSVRASAAAALGHLGNAAAIPYLIQSAKDPEPEVRHDIAFALGHFNSPEVVEALISLSGDPVEDIRSWATFGLGTCVDADTDKIRDALLLRLAETDPEIRGEALIGLAKRHDPRVITPLIQELSGEFYGSWCLEAAELLADAKLLPDLIALKNRIVGRVESRWVRLFWSKEIRPLSTFQDPGIC
jgi:HEAT repeat protein